MIFLKRVTIESNLDVSMYFYKHARTFRRVGGSTYDVVFGKYYVWEFLNHRGKKGVGLVNKDKSEMLLFDLQHSRFQDLGTEVFYFLRKNNIDISKFKDNTPILTYNPLFKNIS